MASEVRRIAVRRIAVLHSLYSERASVYRQRSSRRQTGRRQRTLNYTNRSSYCTAQSWSLVSCATLFILFGCSLYSHACFVSRCNARSSCNQAVMCRTARCSVSLCDTVLFNVTLRLVLPSRRKQTRSTSSRHIIGESTLALVLHRSSAWSIIQQRCCNRCVCICIRLGYCSCWSWSWW